MLLVEFGWQECAEYGAVESVTIVPSSRSAVEARVYVRYRRAAEAELALRTIDNRARGGLGLCYLVLLRWTNRSLCLNKSFYNLFY